MNKTTIFNGLKIFMVIGVLFLLVAPASIMAQVAVDPATPKPTVDPGKPIAQADDYVTDMNTQLVVPAPGVLANDNDPDGGLLTAQLVGGVSFGYLNFKTDGSFTYTPSADYLGDDHFTYQARDDEGQLSSPAMVTITVNATNTPPVANADTYTTEYQTTLVVDAATGVLANDDDAENDPLTAVLLMSPAQGTLDFNTDGSFEYTPDSDFSGDDHFTYYANDGTSDSDTPAMVTITVGIGNTAPVANPDDYETLANTPLYVDAATGVLANDIDADFDPLTAIKLGDPSHGTVALNLDGSFTYIPATDYYGTDYFTYKANDGLEDSAPAQVTIEVIGTNHPPIVTDDDYETEMNTALTVPAPGVLANDTDVDLDPLTVDQNSLPGHGTLTIFEDGAFQYIPDEDWYGTDTFTYFANDGIDNSDTPATVTIEVTTDNYPPVAVADNYTMLADTVLTVSAPGVLANDTDVDGDPLEADLLGIPAHGTVTLLEDGSFVYTPNAGYVGSDQFTYWAFDGLVNSAQAGIVTIDIRLTNNTPVGAADSYLVGMNRTLGVAALNGVLANDIDVDGDVLTAQQVTGVMYGTLTLYANGSFIYTPSTGFLGTDMFIYRAFDGIAYSAQITVTIDVRELYYTNLPLVLK